MTYLGEHMVRNILASTLAIAIAMSTAACGKSTPPPPVDDTRTTQGQMNNGQMNNGQMNNGSPTPKAEGMSTGTKVVLLASAAAAYYMYKKHQTASSATGPDGKYYLSKNGRVYYRDSDHRAHWVTPPPDGIRVPESEANDYRQFQGYDGRTEGRDLAGLGADAND